MAVACFATELELQEALSDIGAEDGIEVETYTPLPPADLADTSRIGAVAFGAWLFGAAFMYGLECLSTVSDWGYPVDIGGRPKFSWPAYVPIAFSFGLFCAALAALAAFGLMSGLLRLWEPVDEADAQRAAMRGAQVLAIHCDDDEQMRRIHARLFNLRPQRLDLVAVEIEEIPA
jgi:Protein of unknown function (DUF3341)